MVHVQFDHLLGGGETQIFFDIFNPDPWGNGIQFDYIIFFQMGWYNHQLIFSIMHHSEVVISLIENPSIIMAGNSSYRYQFGCLKR